MATDKDIYNLVTSHYTSQATTTTSNHASTVAAAAFGYTPTELSSIPSTSNLGLSCGNPLATAHLKPGETLLDLGSGGGLDVFLAARQVGPTGRAIGIDMTASMLSLARQNAAAHAYTNVEFVEANITDLAPIADGSVDVVVSNCVINLVPAREKKRVFAEVYRVLRKGGRVAVSDMLARREMGELRGDVSAYVGCVAGAARVEEYRIWMEEAGLRGVTIVDTGKDVNVYKEGIVNGFAGEGCSTGCCGAKIEVKDGTGRKERLGKVDLNEYVGSFQIYAIKPAS